MKPFPTFILLNWLIVHGSLSSPPGVRMANGGHGGPGAFLCRRAALPAPSHPSSVESQYRGLPAK